MPPATFFDYAESDLPAIANHLRYPVVIKARSGSGVKSGLRYATNQDELLIKFNELNDLIRANDHAEYANPIIQEFIPGYVHDACLLLEKRKNISNADANPASHVPYHGRCKAPSITPPIMPNSEQSRSN